MPAAEILNKSFDRRPKAHFVSSEINVCASAPISTAHYCQRNKNDWPRPDIRLRSTRSPYQQRRPNRVSAPDTTSTGMEGPIRANLHEWGLFNFQELLPMSCNRAKQRTHRRFANIRRSNPVFLNLSTPPIVCCRACNSPSQRSGHELPKISFIFVSRLGGEGLTLFNLFLKEIGRVEHF